MLALVSTALIWISLASVSTFLTVHSSNPDPSILELLYLNLICSCCWTAFSVAHGVVLNSPPLHFLKEALITHATTRLLFLIHFESSIIIAIAHLACAETVRSIILLVENEPNTPELVNRKFALSVFSAVLSGIGLVSLFAPISSTLPVILKLVIAFDWLSTLWESLKNFSFVQDNFDELVIHCFSDVLAILQLVILIFDRPFGLQMLVYSMVLRSIWQRCSSRVAAIKQKTRIRHSISTSFHTPPLDLIRGQECSICLDPYFDDEGNLRSSVKLLPSCRHIFHEECLLSWVYGPNTHGDGANERVHTSCPLCRTPFANVDEMENADPQNGGNLGPAFGVGNGIGLFGALMGLFGNHGMVNFHAGGVNVAVGLGYGIIPALLSFFSSAFLQQGHPRAADRPPMPEAPQAAPRGPRTPPAVPPAAPAAAVPRPPRSSRYYPVFTTADSLRNHREVIEMPPPHEMAELYETFPQFDRAALRRAVRLSAGRIDLVVEGILNGSLQLPPAPSAPASTAAGAPSQSSTESGSVSTLESPFGDVEFVRESFLSVRPSAVGPTSESTSFTDDGIRVYPGSGGSGASGSAFLDSDGIRVHAGQADFTSDTDGDVGGPRVVSTSMNTPYSPRDLQFRRDSREAAPLLPEDAPTAAGAPTRTNRRATAALRSFFSPKPKSDYTSTPSPSPSPSLTVPTTPVSPPRPASSPPRAPLAGGIRSVSRGPTSTSVYSPPSAGTSTPIVEGISSSSFEDFISGDILEWSELYPEPVLTRRDEKHARGGTSSSTAQSNISSNLEDARTLRARAAESRLRLRRQGT